MINKKNIDKMLEMPDDRLISMLKLVLAGVGVNLGGREIDPKTVRKIRAVLTEVTDSDIERVMRLADIYKRGG
jgi:hypothetical protein